MSVHAEAAQEDGLRPLNPEQQAAVDFGEGALQILAGAGSGKTEVLVRRIMRLLERGEDPERIIALTFTTKAANNARERAAARIGSAGRRVWAMTFHAFGVRVLREDGWRLGLRPGFTIYDTDDQERLLKSIIADDLQLDPKVVKPGIFAAVIARLKTELVTVEALRGGRALPGMDGERVSRYLSQLGNTTRRYLPEIYTRYERALAQRNAIDFGDCLLKTVILWHRFPDVAAHWAQRFRHVLVDEYQDTNPAQYAVVRHLASGHGNICVVGDPEQTIMSFQGADRRNILRFASDFPGAVQIRLTRNYRSTRQILEAANAVRAHGDGMRLESMRGDGDPVRLFVAYDPADEADFVVSRIEEGVRAGRSPGEFAILYRTHALSRPFEERLARSRVLPRGIPYVVVGGLRFTDRREVRDLVAYLRLHANPRDLEALRRVVQAPRRGIGERALAQVEERLAADPQCTAIEALSAIKLTSAARKGADELARLFVRGADIAAGGGAIRDLVEHYLYESGYWRLWEELAETGKPQEREEAQERLDNLQQVLVMAGEMDQEGAALDDFLSRLALSASGEEVNVQEAVKLQTLHSAKGLEFPTVFLVALEDDILPFYRAQEEDPDCEEERRLFYVGITRAERELYLTRTRRRQMRARLGDLSIPSRFLEYLPKPLIEDLSRWEIGGSAEAARWDES